MREEKLFRAIGNVGDDLIARADEPVQKKKPVRWAGIAALAACCLIAVGLARLVTLGMGNTSDSTAALDAAAPETAMMQATEDAKSGSAENGALKSEGADDMMDAAANDEEAPAETEDAETTTDTPADSVETWTIGPLTLGMTGDEIQESLGAPDAESNSGPVEETDGSLRVCWFYQDRQCAGAALFREARSGGLRRRMAAGRGHGVAERRLEDGGGHRHRQHGGRGPRGVSGRGDERTVRSCRTMWKFRGHSSPSARDGRSCGSWYGTERSRI